MKSIILTLFMSLVLIACSHTPSENETHRNSVRSSDGGWFMTPEKIALDKYLKFRESGMDHNQALLMLRRYERRAPSKVKQVELRKEIDQKIAYYCFQKEAYERFKSDKNCKKHGSLVYKQCEVENFGHHDRSLISCITKKLKSGEDIAINGIR